MPGNPKGTRGSLSSRPALTDEDRVRILEDAIQHGDAPDRVAFRLGLDKGDVGGVLGFSGWPKVARMQQQLDRLKTDVAMAAVVMPEPETLAPSFPADVVGPTYRDGRFAPYGSSGSPTCTACGIFLGRDPKHYPGCPIPPRADVPPVDDPLDDSFDVHRVRDLVTAGRKASSNRARQLAERLESTARDLDRLVTVERAARMETVVKRAERAEKTDVETQAAAATGSATKARADYHRAFLARHEVTRDELAAWARGRGHTIGSAGMVPRAVLDEYEAAHSG